MFLLEGKEINHVPHPRKGSLRVFFKIIYDGNEISSLGNLTGIMAKQENGTATLTTEGIYIFLHFILMKKYTDINHFYL